jgi:hypothetical protein
LPESRIDLKLPVAIREKNGRTVFGDEWLSDPQGCLQPLDFQSGFAGCENQGYLMTANALRSGLGASKE